MSDKHESAQHPRTGGRAAIRHIGKLDPVAKVQCCGIIETKNHESHEFHEWGKADNCREPRPFDQG